MSLIRVHKWLRLWSFSYKMWRPSRFCSLILSIFCYIQTTIVNVKSFAKFTFNLLYLSNYLKILSKQFNAEWKHLFNYKWKNTKKVSRNINRTEIVISKSKQKKFESDLKNLNVAKNYILLKELNTWELKLLQILVCNVMNDLSIKLKKAKVFFFKMR